MLSNEEIINRKSLTFIYCLVHGLNSFERMAKLKIKEPSNMKFLRESSKDVRQLTTRNEVIRDKVNIYNTNENMKGRR